MKRNVNDLFTGIKDVIKDRADEIVITLTVFFLSFLFFNPVTDDYAFFMSSLAARQFSDFAYFDVHFQGFIGIREVYKLLYYITPAINWHYIFMLIYDVASLYLVLRTLRLLILKNVRSTFIIRLIQLLFSLFYIDNIVFVSHTRVSLIFCGIALFNMLFTKAIQKRAVLAYSAIFIFGMLLRPESGMGMLLLVGIGYLIYTFRPVELIRRISIPILAVAVFVSIFTIDHYNTNVYVNKVEPEIEYKMMAKRVVGIEQMKTTKDSVKYEAALSGMWFDVKEITPEFMRSIILPGPDLRPAYMYDVFHHGFEYYNYYTFLWAVIITLLVLGLFLLPDYRVRVGKILLLEICTFAIVYAIDYNGLLVSYRHFMNLHLMAILISCFYFFDAPAFKKAGYRGVLLTAAILFLLAGLTSSLIKCKNKDVAIYQGVNDMVKTMDKLERKYTNQPIAATIDSRTLFDRQFSFTNGTYTGNTYMMFDWFTFPLTPRYVNYVGRQCNCDGKDPVAFFKWMSKHNGLYIGSAYRRKLTQKYLEVVDGLKVEFGPPVKVNSLAGINSTDTEDDEIATIKVIDN